MSGNGREWKDMNLFWICCAADDTCVAVSLSGLRWDGHGALRFLVRMLDRTLNIRQKRCSRIGRDHG